MFKVGNTSLLFLDSFGIYAKMECENFAGSVKDRVALQMIRDAEKSGELNKKSTIVEATSGNTGIGLAAVAQKLGYKCVIFMPENMSEQRIRLMESYGAEVILTNAEKGMEGSVIAAKNYANEFKPVWIADQFNNPSNWKAHYLSTGPEIWEQTQGNIDVFISGIGTGGTITGIGKFLKENNPNIKVIGVEPLSSPFLSTGKFGSHLIQGIGANFIPSILDTNIYDELILVSDRDAIDYFEKLKTEGFNAGISSGAVLCAAINYMAAGHSKEKIVVLFADGVDRYI